MPSKSNRYPLVVYEHILNRWWPTTLLIGLSSLTLGWLADRRPAFADDRIIHQRSQSRSNRKWLIRSTQLAVDDWRLLYIMRTSPARGMGRNPPTSPMAEMKRATYSRQKPSPGLTTRQFCLSASHFIPVSAPVPCRRDSV